jgi:hypothetical protein
MYVAIHFEYYQQQFANEKDRISWIGHILKGKARRWQQARIKSLTSQRLTDNWGAYWQAAETQLKNEHKITVSGRKLRELKYKGHISDYLVKLKDLNGNVESAGQVFRDQVKSQMPSEIVDIMYTISPIPMEDKEFLRVLELPGTRVEEKRRDSKSADKAPKKEEKHKDNKENKIKNKKDKKEKNYKNNEGSKIQKRDSKKKQEFKFENVKEASKGMSKEMITKHKDAKANCGRCGHEGYYTLECDAKKTENGEEIVKATVSAAKKRKRDDDDNSSLATDKKAKIAATCEHFATQEK